MLQYHSGRVFCKLSAYVCYLDRSCLISDVPVAVTRSRKSILTYIRFVVPTNMIYTHAEVLTIHRIVYRRYGIALVHGFHHCLRTTALLKRSLRAFSASESRRNRRSCRCPYTSPCKANSHKRKRRVLIFGDIPPPFAAEAWGLNQGSLRP